MINRPSCSKFSGDGTDGTYETDETYVTNGTYRFGNLALRRLMSAIGGHSHQLAVDFTAFLLHLRIRYLP